MTEKPTNIDELSPQDEALLALLDATAAGGDPVSGESGDELDRETIEACGLLAQSLDPAPVSAGARAALFARLGLEGAGQDSGAETPRGPASVTPHGSAPSASIRSSSRHPSVPTCTTTR